MKLGVYLQNGPQDYQILQQHDGFADIALGGIVYGGEGIVFARIVEEDSGIIVCPWTACQRHSQDCWEGKLCRVPAGGLYRIETCLNQDGGERMEWSIRGDARHHIGVGDVFVIAGQSNAAGYGRDPIFDPLELGVHLLRGNMSWMLATHPLNDSTDTLCEASRENTNPGHSPFLCFAKHLKKKLGYPVGLVQTARGGSKLCEWNPRQDGVLFDNMVSITSMIHHDIKAIIWSQGCGDTSVPECGDYLERFSSLVQGMRGVYGANLPIVIMQINRATDIASRWHCWGKVKEAQRQAAMQMPNISVIPTNDLSLSDRIHNSSASNLVLGQRLALHTLCRLYDCSAFEAPNIENVSFVTDRTLELTFANVQERIYAFEVPANELAFVIEDDCGSVLIVDYTVQANKLILQLARSVKGVCHIYGATGYPFDGIVPIDIKTRLPILSFIAEIYNPM